MQGECLSPTLFSFFLNDLEERMNDIDEIEVLLISRKIALLKYADNLVLISRRSEGLQKGLDAV